MKIGNVGGQFAEILVNCPPYLYEYNKCCMHIFYKINTFKFAIPIILLTGFCAVGIMGITSIGGVADGTRRINK